MGLLITVLRSGLNRPHPSKAMGVKRSYKFYGASIGVPCTQPKCSFISGNRNLPVHPFWQIKKSLPNWERGQKTKQKTNSNWDLRYDSSCLWVGAQKVSTLLINLVVFLGGYIYGEDICSQILLKRGKVQTLRWGVELFRVLPNRGMYQTEGLVARFLQL